MSRSTENQLNSVLLGTALTGLTDSKNFCCVSQNACLNSVGADCGLSVQHFIYFYWCPCWCGHFYQGVTYFTCRILPFTAAVNWDNLIPMSTRNYFSALYFLYIVQFHISAGYPIFIPLQNLPSTWFTVKQGIPNRWKKKLPGRELQFSPL